MPPDRDWLLLNDVADHAEEALGYLEGVSLAAFRKDRRLQLALERLLEIVGESAGRVSSAAQARVDVDWRGLRALRNVLAHQYDAIDHALLYAAATRRLPGVVQAVRAHLAAQSP
ncbi:MAG TPA: HepT-like ribonuclease domain-containing protein [Candidatus Thermoplasmatota archaeon]|nr:HepT-like ribonuclease domain-containing protein [Candidatus Thermoplasmatota archaeon]